jgi:hypothetical protein
MAAAVTGNPIVSWWADGVVEAKRFEAHKLLYPIIENSHVIEVEGEDDCVYRRVMRAVGRLRVVFSFL